MTKATAYKCRRFINIIRFKAIRIFNKNIEYKGAQYSASSAHFKAESGKIELGMSVCCESGVLIQASSGKVEICDSVYINRNTTIVSHDMIRIGKGTTIGPNVCIYDHDHDYKCRNGKMISAPIFIGENVWIGAGAIILRGSTIGDNAVIGAGTIVKGNLPSNTIITTYREYKIKPINNIV